MKAIRHNYARYEIWPVILFTAAALVSESLLPWAAGGLALAWAASVFLHGQPASRTPIDWPAALLLALLPVTLWASAERHMTLVQALRLFAGIAGFYLLAGWARTPRRQRRAWWGLSLVGFALAASAPFMVEWSIDKLPLFPASLYQYFFLLTDNPANPNVIAGFLAVLALLPLAGLLWLRGELRGWERGLVAAGCLGMLVILVLSQSRGAWLGFASGLALLAALRWRAGAWLIVLALAGALAAGAALGPQRALDWLTLESALSGGSGRLEIWSRAIFMIQDFSFTGVGMGTFGRVADLLYPFFGYEAGSVPHAHNLFLQVAVDLGLPGLVGWLAAWLLAVWMAARVFQAGRVQLAHPGGAGQESSPTANIAGRADRAAWLAAIGSGLLAGSLALVVHGLTDAVTWGMVRPAPLIWWLWGLGAAVFIQLEQDRPQP